MKKLLLPFLSIFTMLQPSFSQVSFVKDWDYRYGGTANDKMEIFQQTSDGGYIMGGNTVSDLGGDVSQPSRGNSDFWVVKTDRYGVKQWDKRFGGSLMDELHSLQQTADGGYIIGGDSRSGATGDKTEPNWDVTSNPSPDYWIVKIDSMGNKQWDKRYGGIWADNLYCVKQCPDGGFILGGYSISGVSGDKTQPSWGPGPDYWVIKTDMFGNKQWDKRYGGDKNDQLVSLVLTTDGGYLLGGFSWSTISGEKSEANNGAINYCDYWVVKIDASGNKQWDKCYGGDLNDQLDLIINTKDGGYMLGGYSWSNMSGDKSQPNFGPDYTSDYWLLKIEPNGARKWDKTIGGDERENDFGLLSQTADKGFLLSGTSYSNISGCKTESNLGIEQSWIVKMDSLGHQEWDKTIITNGHDEASFAIQNNDGSYVLANHSNGGIGGFKSQLNQDSSNNTYDYWILKLFDPTIHPNANYTSSNNSFCRENCMDFTNLSMYANSYHWIFNGASPSTSSDMNPHGICYPTPGSYDVTLIASNSYGNDTITLQDYVTVFAGPTPFSVVYNSDTLFAPQGLATYQWYQSNTIINGATNYYYVPSQSGTYGVLVTDNNGCSVGSSILIASTGISKTEIDNDVLELFPNPAANDFTILIKSSRSGNRIIELYNSIGQVVYEKEIKANAGENKFVIDSHNLPTGVYILKLTNGDKTILRRVGIER